MSSAIVVMGVSGCGKSTLGQALAKRLGRRFVEGDDLHPASNVARMAAGVPLTDADRSAWLQALCDELRKRDGHSVVLACSALKRAYRDQLRTAAPSLQLVYLEGQRGLFEARMRSRSGHYMPVSLLQSQLDTLEPPDADEGALTLDAALALPELTAAALQGLGLEHEHAS